MKTQTNSEISRDLNALQAYLQAIQKAEAGLAKCKADHEKMQTRLDDLGIPDYENDEARSEQNNLRDKISLCADAAARHEQTLGATLEKLTGEIYQFCNRTESIVMQPLYMRRRQTVAAVIRPFCDTDDAAEHLAKDTYACKQAWRAMNRIGSVMPEQHVITNAKALVAILKEAAKDGGDLMQFLDPEKLAKIYS